MKTINFSINCAKWQAGIVYNSTESIEFDDRYSTNVEKALAHINKIWYTKTVLCITDWNFLQNP